VSNDGVVIFYDSMNYPICIAMPSNNVAKKDYKTGGMFNAIIHDIYCCFEIKAKETIADYVIFTFDRFLVIGGVN
jgi:hypothetical protein